MRYRIFTVSNEQPARLMRVGENSPEYGKPPVPVYAYVTTGSIVGVSDFSDALTRIAEAYQLKANDIVYVGDTFFLAMNVLGDVSFLVLDPTDTRVQGLYRKAVRHENGLYVCKCGHRRGWHTGFGGLGTCPSGFQPSMEG